MTVVEAPGVFVVIMDVAAPQSERDRVTAFAVQMNPGASVTLGDGWGAIAVAESASAIDVERFRRLPAVRDVVRVTAPYRLASRELFGGPTEICLPRLPSAESNGTTAVGERASITVMAVCGSSVDDEERLRAAAHLIREAGATAVVEATFDPDRDGSPTTAGETPGRLREMAEDIGMCVCIDVSEPRQIAKASEFADLLQVGTANMQDFSLLREIGRTDVPVLLKRGSGATVEEFLLAAEYVLTAGNGRVILCESGIRTFDSVRQPRFEINAVPLIKRATHLPLLADPSHATAHARLVPAVARAAIAAGADGLLLEVATNESQRAAESAIGMPAFRELMQELRVIAPAVRRHV